VELDDDLTDADLAALKQRPDRRKGVVLTALEHVDAAARVAEPPHGR
jgi:hypothetical protein